MNEVKVIENKEEIVIYNNDLNTKVYLKKFTISLEKILWKSSMKIRIS